MEAAKAPLLQGGLLLLLCAAGINPPAVSAQTPNHAISESQRALKQAREAHDRRGEANALHSLGDAYGSLGQAQKALEFLNPAVPIYKEMGDLRNEATTLTAIGEAYWSLDQKQDAFKTYNQALPIARDAGDQSGEAVTLTDIGEFYAETGEPQTAVKFQTQALKLERAGGDRSNEATTLNNIGAVYMRTGEQRKALEFYQQSLPIQREVRDKTGEAVTLSNIATVYATMGQPQKALDLYQQALQIERQGNDRRAEASTLGTIAGAYFDLHQWQTALRYYDQALYIQRQVGDRSAQALSLTDIAATYSKIAQPRRARELYNQALAKEKEPGDRMNRAYTLWGLASLESTNALECYLAALDIAQSANNPDLQGAINSSLMEHFRKQRQFQTAIFFGRQAVNEYQQIRNMNSLDTELVASFVRSKSDVYRRLAELLAEQDRLMEAERILDLLKEQELKETVRGGISHEASVTKLPATDADNKAKEDIAGQESVAGSLVVLAEERDALQAKETRTPAEEARLEYLNGEVAKGKASIRHFFDITLFNELGATQNANSSVGRDEEESSSISSELRHLPPHTIAVYTLVTDQHTYLIVITPALRLKREARLSGEPLRSKVFAVREQLRMSASHPQKDLQDLYDALLGPILPDLQAADAHTILWSLDGVLRYLPMNALYDGKEYLIEKYNNVVITPASRNHLLDTARPAEWRLLAMGLSKSYLGELPLQGVDVELNAIVHDPKVPTSHGPMPGRLLENDDFTLATFQQLSIKFPVLHVASHFIFDPGNIPEPYLLLGGNITGGTGYKLTTSEMSDKLEFTGVQLLTLSACSTALADKLPNGREMDSLGMIAQKNDAAAVMSTLWDVNDASTSILMSDFYARWLNGKSEPKVEALRQAQLDLLHGTANAAASTARGSRVAHTDATTVPRYSDPYYWAPFVLVGNFQ